MDAEKIITDLREYTKNHCDEIQEACDIMIELYNYRDYLSKEFNKILLLEMNESVNPAIVYPPSTVLTIEKA